VTVHRRTILVAVGFALPVVTVAAVLLAGAPAGSDRLAEPLGADRADAAAAIAGLARDTTESQRPALADGVVTLAEYRAAADRAVACLTGRLRAEAARRFEPGTAVVEVDPPRLSPDGFRLTWSYGVRFPGGMPTADVPPSLADVPAEVDRACQDEHVDDVQAGYQLGRLADERFVARVDAGFVACLRGAGVAVREGDDARAALADAAAARGDLAPAIVDCVERFPAVTDAPGG
jgi:hypothetical protein